MSGEKEFNGFKKLNSILTYILIVFIQIDIIWVLFKTPYLHQFIKYKPEHYIFALLIISSLLIFVLKELFYLQKVYCINVVDFCVISILAIILGSRSPFSNTLFWNEITVNFFVICASYVVCRYIISEKTIDIFFYWITISVLAELIYLLIQFIKFSYSSSSIHFTGSLGNSGLCAGFFAITAPAIFFIIKKNESKFLTLSIFFFYIILLIKLQSRSAMICFTPNIYFLKNIWPYSKSSTRRIIVGIFILLILAILLYSLEISAKFNSAQGRWYIWIISLRHFKEYIFTGIGFGNFSHFYQNWQIEYFKTGNGNSKFGQLADLPVNAFNEPIQIFIETGILGLFFFALLIVLIFRMKALSNMTKQTICLKLILGSVFLFSLFSYPFHSAPILLITVITTACVSSMQLKRYQITLTRPFLVKSLLICLLLPLFYVGYYFYTINKKINQWSELRFSSKNDSYKKRCYLILNRKLDTNGSFLFDYGFYNYKMGKYVEAIKIFEKSNSLRPNINSLLYIGLCYQNLKYFDKAEAIFLKMQYCSPKLLTPKFLLLRLYILEKDKISSLRVARNIVESNIVIPSFEALSIKKNAEDYLLKNQ